MPQDIDPNRCRGHMTVGGRRCYFNKLPGQAHCAGHTKAPAGPIDMDALDDHATDIGPVAWLRECSAMAGQPEWHIETEVKMPQRRGRSLKTC